jgi:uncharacterized protein (TIGR00369 family)
MNENSFILKGYCMTSKLEMMQQVIANKTPFATIATTLGIEAVSLEKGIAVLKMETDTNKHANPMGTVHGGVLTDLADLAMGSAFSTVIEDDESFTTIELKINYLKPVWNDTLTATAKVKKTGSTVGLIECEVHDSKGSLVAYTTSTCMILRGTKKEGR